MISLPTIEKRSHIATLTPAARVHRGQLGDGSLRARETSCDMERVLPAPSNAESLARNSISFSSIIQPERISADAKPVAYRNAAWSSRPASFCSSVIRVALPSQGDPPCNMADATRTGRHLAGHGTPCDRPCFRSLLDGTPGDPFFNLTTES